MAANLGGADLTEAAIDMAQLSAVAELTGVRMPDGQLFDPAVEYW
jgi:uncharacterized protein YjbI with pentapeptide repeats